MAARSEGAQAGAAKRLAAGGGVHVQQPGHAGRAAFAFEHVPLDAQREVGEAMRGGGARQRIAGALAGVAVRLEPQFGRLADAVAQQRRRGHAARGAAGVGRAVAGQARLDLEMAGADDGARFDEVGAVGLDAFVGLRGGAQQRAQGQGGESDRAGRMGHGRASRFGPRPRGGRRSGAASPGSDHADRGSGRGDTFFGQGACAESNKTKGFCRLFFAETHVQNRDERLNPPRIACDALPARLRDTTTSSCRRFVAVKARPVSRSSSEPSA